MEAHLFTKCAKPGNEDRPVFIVHPGNRGSAPNWPIGAYAELARQLQDAGHVIVTGTAGENDLIATITEAAPQAHAVIGWPLLDFAALLEAADVVTVSSTGPMHLAAVLGTPVVALFGNARAVCPEKWAPLTDRCTILTPQSAPSRSGHVIPPARPTTPEALDIPVDAVLDALAKRLAAA